MIYMPKSNDFIFGSLTYLTTVLQNRSYCIGSRRKISIRGSNAKYKTKTNNNKPLLAFPLFVNLN